MEFTRPEGVASHDLALEEAMSECRICVVRRMEAQDRGQSVFTTSIWAFSKDGSVRMQLLRKICPKHDTSDPADIE